MPSSYRLKSGRNTRNGSASERNNGWRSRRGGRTRRSRQRCGSGLPAEDQAAKIDRSARVKLGRDISRGTGFDHFRGNDARTPHETEDAPLAAASSSPDLHRTSARGVARGALRPSRAGAVEGGRVRFRSKYWTRLGTRRTDSDLAYGRRHR